MRLSANFTERELIKSQTAKESNIDNRPGERERSNLLFLCVFLLQPIRDFAGPVQITSAYRSPALNAAIRGSKTSQHPKGEAADIRTPYHDLYEVYSFIIKNLKFGQVIYEAPPGKDPWIHVSLPRIGKENQQGLLWDGDKYTKFEGR